MPPKRKTKRKPPKRSKSQSQSQRQSVVVNVGKTTTTKRRRNAGRGGLPAHQQNLFPPTIIQQQANLGNLENEISRLTAFIKERQPINNLVTPLSSSVNVQPSMPGIKAEERRAGPTASNFQPLPSESDDAFARELQQELDTESRVEFQQKDKPFAVVQKGDEILPVVYGAPKLGRPFVDKNKMTQAEPIGPPIADFNRTVNLVQGEALDPQGITSFKQTEPAFVPITIEQSRRVSMLQKQASLTSEEKTERTKLLELYRESRKQNLLPKGFK